jgi:hypothetical protein
MTVRTGRRLLVHLTVAVLLAAILALPAVRATHTEEFDLWANVDVSDFGVEDIYRWNKVYLFPNTNFCLNDFLEFTKKDGYAGQVSWQWMIERIQSTNPTYDFYAVYLQYTLNPSWNKGNPDPGNIEYADYKNQEASVKIDVFASERVSAYKPDTSTGSESASYGITASVGTTGSSASFSQTTGYTKPEVTITANTDSNWGGQHIWDLDFGGAAPEKQFTFYFTVLIATNEGTDLELDLTMKWRLESLGCPVPWTEKHIDEFWWEKTLRLYFPPDVTLYQPASDAIGSSSVTIDWSQYAGAYFANYQIFYKKSSVTSWTYSSTITSVGTTSKTVAGLDSSTSYDFQVKWEVTYGYGRFTNVVSATTDPSGGGGGGGGGGGQPPVPLDNSGPGT